VCNLKAANFKKSDSASDVYIAFYPQDAVPSLFRAEMRRNTRRTQRSEALRRIITKFIALTTENRNSVHGDPSLSDQTSLAACETGAYRARRKSLLKS